MPALDGSAYKRLGGKLWERMNAAIDNYESTNGAPVQTEADINAVITSVFGERTGDNAADFDAAMDCLQTVVKRQGTPTSAAAKELLQKDAERDAQNKATGQETAALVLKRELTVLVTKSQGNFLDPNEYWHNEEAMAAKKKQIFATFPSGRAQSLIDEAVREGIAAAA